MVFMKHFLYLVLVSLCFGVSVGYPDYCTSPAQLTALAKKCYTDLGLKIYTTDPKAKLSLDVFEQCREQENYLKGTQCLRDILKTCDDKVPTLISKNNTESLLTKMCNDSQVQLDCIRHTSSRQRQLRICVLRKFVQDTAFPKTAHERLCRASKYSTDCLLSSYTVCDQYTGDFFHANKHLMVPEACEEPVIG